MDVMDVLKDNNNEELLSDAEEIVEEMSRSESDDEENSKRYENIPTEVVNAAKEFEEFTREKGVSEIILGKEGSTLRRKGWSPWFVYKKDEGLSFLNHPFLGVRYIKLDSEGKILIYNRPKLTWIPKRINPEVRTSHIKKDILTIFYSIEKDLVIILMIDDQSLTEKDHHMVHEKTIYENHIHVIHM